MIVVIIAVIIVAIIVVIIVVIFVETSISQKSEALPTGCKL